MSKRKCPSCGDTKDERDFYSGARRCRTCVAAESGERRSEAAQEHREHMRAKFGVKLAPSTRRFKKLHAAALQQAESVVPQTLRSRAGRTCRQAAMACGIGVIAAPMFVAPAFDMEGAEVVVPAMACFAGSIALVYLAEYLEGPRQSAVADVLQAILTESVKRAEREQLEYLRFYTTHEWRAVRNSIIERDGRTCRMCSEHIRHARDLSVDHIQPRSKFPHLALELSNLQVLCRRCNSAKGARI